MTSCSHLEELTLLPLGFSPEEEKPPLKRPPKEPWKTSALFLLLTGQLGTFPPFSLLLLKVRSLNQQDQKHQDQGKLFRHLESESVLP
jgi:hypothetical protein